MDERTHLPSHFLLYVNVPFQFCFITTLARKIFATIYHSELIVFILDIPFTYCLIWSYTEV